MPVVAYLANQFPSPVEPYVADEIRELRRRGIDVLPCSAKRPEKSLDEKLKCSAQETLYLQPLQPVLLLAALWLCAREFSTIKDLLWRVLVQGEESPQRRIRALLHTWLGAYYALLLKDRGIEHIHVHHGYFASWIALVAARLLSIEFSMTLHGSDLLLHRAFLDTKLEDCILCFTISGFNRRYILDHYANVSPEKIIIRRLGVDTAGLPPIFRSPGQEKPLLMLSVGRLHPVKDHAFLVRACRMLKDRNVSFLCLIAGEGSERTALEKLICKLDLQDHVKLLGHASRDRLSTLYPAADLVVLTSRSEGIPVALMEAMAYGKLVLAPEITGIPELVIPGETGFLYQPGSLANFVARVEDILRCLPALAPLGQAARLHVSRHFNHQENLDRFADEFLSCVTVTSPEHNFYENPVLQ